MHNINMLYKIFVYRWVIHRLQWKLVRKIICHFNKIYGLVLQIWMECRTTLLSWKKPVSMPLCKISIIEFLGFCYMLYLSYIFTEKRISIQFKFFHKFSEYKKNIRQLHHVVYVHISVEHTEKSLFGMGNELGIDFPIFFCIEWDKIGALCVCNVGFQNAPINWINIWLIFVGFVLVNSTMNCVKIFWTVFTYTRIQSTRIQ